MNESKYKRAKVIQIIDLAQHGIKIIFLIAFLVVGGAKQCYANVETVLIIAMCYIVIDMVFTCVEFYQLLRTKILTFVVAMIRFILLTMYVGFIVWLFASYIDKY